MLALARRLTEATGAPARWIEADVLATPHELDGTADLVYTGRGSIIWLHDLDAWAEEFLALESAGWKGEAGSALDCDMATRILFAEALEGAARRGRLGETIAAMTPCMRLYAWLGQSLARTAVAPPM